MNKKYSNLENYFNQYIKNITHWLPDGFVDVDLTLLHKQGLLHFHRRGMSDSVLTRYFNVVESEEKLTLVNNEFVVWIVPEKNDIEAKTTTLIALNKNEELQLEMAFVTAGIYNNSYLVLRLLEKFLLEIHGTEDLISRLELSNS
jgi:hypothetical protein